tara:strand:- start:659 stop:1360 length:702 start_codon:yes stop_codon:yes gene_type:complete
MIIAGYVMELPEHIIVKHSTRARRLALRLDTKARAFNLVVPKGMSMRRARAFVESHEEWMQERLDAMPTSIQFIDGASLPILGKERLIDIYYSEDIKRTSIAMDEHYIYVRTNKEDPSGRIIRFLKMLAKTELEKLSRKKAAEIDKSVKSVTIRDTKSRWGSCSYDGKLSYSWRLIFAPYASFDYVVAHEVAHLQHLDHSTAFWNVCRALSEDYLNGHSWMQEHASDELMRYG